jgi:hypothetical protein
MMGISEEPRGKSRLQMNDYHPTAAALGIQKIKYTGLQYK